MKWINIREITLSTGGTETIPLNVSASEPTDLEGVRITGTNTLVSNYAITPSGTAHKNMQCMILWEATCTHSGNTVTIFGETIPSDIVDGNFIAFCTYNGSSWVVNVIPDWAVTLLVDTNRIIDSAVTTGKIKDSNVTMQKIEDLTAGQLIVGNASNKPTKTTITGDVTIDSSGVTAIGALKVLNAMINSLDASKLTGIIDNARLSSVPMSVLASATKLATKYTDTGTTAVTTEETLYSELITGGEIDVDGKGIRVTFAGTFGANANTKTIKAKFGGNIYSTNAVTTAPNGTDFYGEFEVIRTGATGAVGFSFLEAAAVSQGIQKSKAGVTWGNDNYVVITGQNGTASANDIVLSMVIVEKIH